ncbi:MAG: DUF2752 domain-containing protein [Sandaracinaceae bacterium]|nr:DUF2752 domain-containing protein [Sandaracinaceae bacterium]
MTLGAIAIIDFPICPTRLMFGIPCPGCGLTRASVALLSGDLVAMLRFHPLAPILGPLVAWEFGMPLLVELGLVKKAWLERMPKGPKYWAHVLAVALFGLWGLRLFGLLGGSVDPIDPAHSWAGQLFSLLISPFAS